MSERPRSDAPMIVDASFKETPQEDLDLEAEAEKEERTFLDEFEINDNVHQYKARIYRFLNGEQIYIEQLGLDKFPILDRLRDVHGGGTFRALIFKNNKIWKNKTYKVEAKPDAPVVGNSQITDIAQLIKTQNEQMAAILQGNAPNAPATDPMMMFTGMMAAIASMKEVFAPPAADNQMQSMELFLKAFELAQSVGGDGGSSSVYDVIKELIKSPLAEKIGVQLEEHAAQSKRIAPPQTQPNAVNLNIENNPRPEQPEPAPTIEGLPPQAVEQLTGQLRLWADRAKAGSDPALYADLVLDTYEPEIIEMVLFRPDLKEIAAIYAPDSQQNWQWFEALILEIRQGLTQDIGGEDKGEINQGSQPEVITPDALAQRPNEIGRAAASNNSEHPQRSGGDKGNAPPNGKANPRGKKEPSRKTTGNKSSPKSAAKSAPKRD